MNVVWLRWMTKVNIFYRQERTVRGQLRGEAEERERDSLPTPSCTSAPTACTPLAAKTIWKYTSVPTRGSDHMRVSTVQHGSYRLTPSRSTSWLTRVTDLSSTSVISVLTRHPWKRIWSITWLYTQNRSCCLVNTVRQSSPAVMSFSLTSVPTVKRNFLALYFYLSFRSPYFYE